MRFSTAAAMLFILAAVVSSVAQTKTITNADLEKYRQARLSAEREYRENYERLGMPSPAELEKRREQSRFETERLSEKLRAEEIERERIDVQRDVSMPRYAEVVQVPSQLQGYSPIYFWSYGRRYRSPLLHRAYQPSGYVAGGQFWPTGSSTPPRPAFKRVRR